ncbi:hypothetical protein, partial [Aeromonas enteropelogenes]|uniref:hypothetical protein n=1 Tax=Aeromonas enteropelogenes TaxID=29489 RepID=UPI003F7423D5
ENQKLFLMLDAVSAHTDCLIQIVKELRNFHRCGSGILLNRPLESSLIFTGFSRLPTRLFALPLAVSMEAHYRAANQLGKAFFEDYCQYRLNRSNTHQTMHFPMVFTPRHHQH